MTAAQPFPAGADTRPGHCAGVFCQGRPATVVAARVGPSWRQALALDLCADCLADFAVANLAQLTAGGEPVHVYAQGRDELFHEVKV